MLKFRQKQVVRGVRLAVVGSVVGCSCWFSTAARAAETDTYLFVTASQALANWLASSLTSETNHAATAAEVAGAVGTTRSNAAAATTETNEAEEVKPLFPDMKRLNALGMIETGNDDYGVGGMGEISRFQIQPAIWKNYSKSDDYQNPEISEGVARRHWAYLAGYFKEKTGREPTDFDMYVLWNTRLGYYAKNGFSPVRISPVVQDRAQRFVNLVNRKKYPGEQ